MSEPILKIKIDRLTSLLKKTYELGCRGWPELADEVADTLVQECIASLPQVSNDPSPGPQGYQGPQGKAGEKKLMSKEDVLKAFGNPEPAEQKPRKLSGTFSDYVQDQTISTKPVSNVDVTTLASLAEYSHGVNY